MQISGTGSHLVAAGAWLGGLIPLVLILSMDRGNRAVSPAADLDRVLMRFSGMGYVAVATLVGTGLINSWYLVGNVTGLPTTQYGQLLLAKLALFAGMLSLAAINRFLLVPTMSKAYADGGGPVWAGRLRAHVIGEQALGVLVLSIVSVLGTIRPAVGQ